MAHKILFVEDDQSFYDIFSIPLVNRGYEVVHVADGSVAFNKAVEFMPDIVLLDIILPGESGLDILKELKENDQTKKIKVIMLTNFGSDDNVNKAMELGADDYFMKYNVVPTELPEKVATILGEPAGPGISVN